jgi:hypothetical protein
MRVGEGGVEPRMLGTALMHAQCVVQGWNQVPQLQVDL